MRIVRYIFASLVLLCAWSCSHPDLEFGAVEEGAVQIVPRVLPFGDVETKANKLPEEQAVTSQAIAVFNQDGTCVYFNCSEGGGSFLISPESLAESYTGLGNCSVYAFANMPQLSEWSLNDAWKSKTADDFLSVQVPVTGVGIPENGFPMMGVTSGVNLDPSDQIEYLISVEMVSAYAKVVVNMKVNSELDLSSGNSSYFLPEKWVVNNVPSDVDFKAETSPSSVLTSSFTSSVFTGSQATPSSEVSFVFYLPERFLDPADTDFVYPFVEANGGVLRDEDKGLRQRYKPDLLGDDQKATYVSIVGMFSDHQGHRKNITYDLYVGENNYDDFNVRRNVQYNNNVTIKSAKKNSAYGFADGQVAFENTISYDGRVHFEESDYIVRFERETLLDAHWEVRPFRLNVLDGSVTVEIKDADSTPWIRMEKASSKRDYFTTDLVTNTLKDNTAYANLGIGEHCLWLYVDENTEKAEDGFRTAVINITHANGDKTTSLDYTIAQRYLYPVTYGDRTYNIEYHEEYLFNYDSMDPHGQTDFEGMPWGLENVPLSNKNKAIVFNTGDDGFKNILDYFINQNVVKVSPFYDFYLPRDVGTNTDLVSRSYSGYVFVSEIEKTLETTDFGKITLYDNPRSAIEYCYNKNKRNSSGEVETMNWYLPAIDEMEEIAIGGYEVFAEFQNKYYWSSQPAYIQNRAHYHNLANEKGAYYTDDYGCYYVQAGKGSPATQQEYDGPGFARATKVNFLDGEYTWAYSGVSGYQDIFEIPGNGDPKVYVVPNKYDYKYQILWWEETKSFEENETLQRQEGNQLRTKYNRVRCVYKK